MTLLTLRLVSSGLYGEKPSGEGALRGGVTLPLCNHTFKQTHQLHSKTDFETFKSTELET